MLGHSATVYEPTFNIFQNEGPHESIPEVIDYMQDQDIIINVVKLITNIITNFINHIITNFQWRIIATRMGICLKLSFNVDRNVLSILLWSWSRTGIG